MKVCTEKDTNPCSFGDQQISPRLMDTNERDRSAVAIVQRCWPRPELYTLVSATIGGTLTHYMSAGDSQFRTTPILSVVNESLPEPQLTWSRLPSFVLR